MNVDDPTLFWNAPQDDQGRAARPVLLSLHDAQQDEGCARLAYFRIVTRLSQQHMPAPQARSAAFIAIHEFQEAVLAVALKGAYVAPDGYLLWDPTFTFKGLDVTDPRVAPLLLRAKALLELMGGSTNQRLARLRRLRPSGLPLASRFSDHAPPNPFPMQSDRCRAHGAVLGGVS